MRYIQDVVGVRLQAAVSDILKLHTCKSQTCWNFCGESELENILYGLQLSLGRFCTVGWKSPSPRRRCVSRRRGPKPSRCCYTTCTRAGPASALPGKRCCWTSWAWLTATASSRWRTPPPSSSAPSSTPTMSAWFSMWPVCTPWVRSVQPAVRIWTDMHLRCWILTASSHSPR